MAWVLGPSTNWRGSSSETPPTCYNIVDSTGYFWFYTSSPDISIAYIGGGALDAPGVVYYEWKIAVAGQLPRIFFDAGGYGNEYDQPSGAAVGVYQGQTSFSFTGATSLTISNQSIGASVFGIKFSTTPFSNLVVPTGNGDFPSPFTWQDANGKLPPAGFANDTDGTNF